MKTNLKFWIEVLEDGTPKIVPHDGKKCYQFISKATALDFLRRLRKNNPDEKFRLVTCKETITSGSWEDKKTETNG